MTLTVKIVLIEAGYFLINWGVVIGTVGCAVSSEPRGPLFKSSHRELLLNNYLLLTVCGKDENK